MHTQLTIATRNIRQHNNRYLLNDIHKASGGENRHSPRYFLSNKQTKDLVNEIEKDGIPSFKSIQRVGTYACKELVYAYAMWISPRFHLHVIRAFDQLTQQHSDPAYNPLTDRQIEMLKALIARRTQSPQHVEQVHASLRKHFNTSHLNRLRQMHYADALLHIDDIAPSTALSQPADEEQGDQTTLPTELVSILYRRIDEACKHQKQLDSAFNGIHTAIRQAHDSFERLQTINELLTAGNRSKSK